MNPAFEDPSAPSAALILSRKDAEALKEQNERLLYLFRARGYVPVQPPIMQPADVFLERSGEQIRARTFLFTDPDGREELCLRPDLTVPICRLHLQQAEDPAAEARYACLGPVFRYHARKDPRFPDEYHQAGVEWLGHAQDARAAADAEVVRLCVVALRRAGLKRFRLTLGDIGLVRALLADMPIPSRWREKLLMRFNRQQAFRQTLMTMAGRIPHETGALAGILKEIARLAPADIEAAAALVQAHLNKLGTEVLAGRSVEDIARRLLEKAEDMRLPPLADAHVARIEALLAVQGEPQRALSALAALSEKGDGHFAEAVARLADVIGRLEDVFAAGECHFSAGFGRTLEYYTGMVFSIEAEIGGEWLTVAGGGRYDDMLSSLGGPDVPACGFGIHTERLFLATHNGATA
ncbi:ATP phosphoribosyltransferase regulatory subunit [Thermopetrobacter sp. TC1]|uniref:ATP phosphoribosyltransferase regulatory subunit n=1 Tax=Thermopetrobacter sp. TC1 TaxID=1495045 RepID=UPI00068FDB59|nr:ATP phosphoribosyltransferase regulatory subunit [Thermopetrobacter sp. TC1]